MSINRQVTLAARPVGYPKESDFALIEAPVPEPRHGEVLVRALWLSLDPYQRGRMNDSKSLCRLCRHWPGNGRRRRRPGHRQPV